MSYAIVRRPSSVSLVCLSVCLSVCPSVNILRKSLLLPDEWLDCDQTCTWWSPDGPASRMCSRSRSRSKVTWYGHFCDLTKIASSRRQMTRSRPNVHTTVHSPACITFLLLHSPSRLHIRQLDLMSKSRNELLRHWRSGFYWSIDLFTYMFIDGFMMLLSEGKASQSVYYLLIAISEVFARQMFLRFYGKLAN